MSKSEIKFTNDMLIWSADVSAEDIKDVVDHKALPYGTIIKLDRAFFECNPDKDIIEWLEEQGYPVFVDAKIVEVPSKCLEIARIYLAHRPFMLNIMAGAVSTRYCQASDPDQCDTLKRFADECEKVGTMSCAVTVLTSKTEVTVNWEFNASALTQVLKYAHMAAKAGITDLVCSPDEVKWLRDNGTELSLNTPGVRPAGSSHDDQQRVSTPGQAILHGANRLVIGRPLLAGEGPIWERIARNYEPIRNEVLDAIAELNATKA